MPEQTSARVGLAPARGKNLDELRRSNLSLALGLIHRRGRLARSELTRELGLNRSTIAALVTELVARGLAVESMPTATGHVGRPSLTITPSQSIAAIAVRPEVDAVTIALVGLGGRVVREVRYDTSGVPSAREVATIVRAIVEGMAITESMSYDIHGVGLAIPGLVRASDGLVVFAPHLGWRDEPLARKLAEQTGFEVSAANDALCGAIAEFTFGAGQGATDMVYLHGGPSGIGGGIVVDGSLVSGAHGYAGELGHTLVNSLGALCHCGATGCLEAEVRREPLLTAVGLDGAHADSLRPALQAALDAGTRPDVRGSRPRTGDHARDRPA
ncbi:putative NBD/HSP70 family sugar kinase [Microbacteriaceae bacterium SG_E_30_P1]|uniref:NBD/HSP70 family sugar kinase n=1 Tax=Antiquaquibacter oligotrophicus TaxID=2880260 RepID=A0ABT6KQT6_9MICO|nr:ROK family protein [Antiquaquibacter oligotrophicus]MDH6182343.1 putative NBD/HSP70 family sugar kinase [Antiquaquibacter oligotrophicus]UDF12004.1 ROK family transcriptional regulator [Antiquaquibacter oligotrophicus]